MRVHRICHIQPFLPINNRHITEAEHYTFEEKKRTGNKRASALQVPRSDAFLVDTMQKIYPSIVDPV